MKNVLMAAFLLLSSSASALAYDCTSRVADEVGVLDTSALQDALGRLIAAGAEPRVRIIKTFTPHGNLDRYERDWVMSCEPMQDPNGYKKTNLVTILVSMTEKESGLYYGESYVTPLDPVDYEIRKQTIGSRLRRGDFTEAVNAGLVALTKVINDYENPVLVQPQNSPSTDTVVVERKPTIVVSKEAHEPPSGSWWWLWGLLGLAGVAGMGTVSYQLFQRRMVLQAAFEDMDKARLACAGVIGGKEQDGGNYAYLQELTVRKENLQEKVHDEDVVELQQVLTKLVKQQEVLQNRFSNELEGARTSEAETVENFQRLAMSYDLCRAEAEELKRDMDEFAAKLQELKQIAATAGFTINRTRETWQAAVEMVDSLAREGYRVEDAKQLLHEAESHIDTAVAAKAERRYLSMLKAVGDADEVSIAAGNAAKAKPELRKSLQQRHTKLVEHLSSVRELRKEAKLVFKRLSAEFAIQSWNTVSNNGSTAEAHIDDAVPAIDAIVECVSMSEQDWVQAENAAEYAEKALSEAEELVRAIVELERSIIASRERSPTELEAAEADIDNAASYLERHASDVASGLRKELATARDILKKAQSEYSKKKPNYLRVIQLALKANHAADSVFATAEDQHQAVERKRRLAETSYREAVEMIDTAERYMRNHRGDVHSAAETSLSSARTYIGMAVGDLEMRIMQAQEAERAAEESLRKAKRNVADAERRRREAREEEARRARARRRSEDSWSSSSSSSGSWGGGSSSSFGSFGSGGGNSGSW